MRLIAIPDQSHISISKQLFATREIRGLNMDPAKQRRDIKWADVSS